MVQMVTEWLSQTSGLLNYSHQCYARVEGGRTQLVTSYHLLE